MRGFSLGGITKKRSTALACLLVLAILLFSGCAAPPAKTITIGLVSLTPVLDPALEAFKDRMAKDFGYVEGIKVKYIYARQPGTPTVGVDQVKDNLKAMMSPDVDLIASMNTAAVQALKTLSADSGKPIIFMGVWDPINVSPQIVPNLSQPGGNITGVRGGGSEAKRVEWFKKIVPTIKRLYAPYRATDPAGTLAIGEAKEAGAKLGIEFVTPVVTDNNSITAAFNAIPKDVDGIWLAADGAISSRSADIAAIAIQHKLPYSAINPSHALDGALFSFGYDIKGVGWQGARIADQVLRGMKVGNFKAGDIPIETADFPLYINLNTARNIGVTISNDILQQADRVIHVGEKLEPTPTGAPASNTPAPATPIARPSPVGTSKDF